MTINYGNWKDLAELDAATPQWQDPYHSSLGGMIASIDPTMKVPGLNKVSGFVHEGETRIMSGLNRVLAPVSQLEAKTVGKIDPVRASLARTFPTLHQNVTQWVANHPADTAAIAAASYFSGWCS